MADIVDKIMAEFETDPLIHAKSLNLVVGSKGFLRRRKTLEVLGTTESTAEKERAIKIVQRQVGDGYDVEDKVVVVGER